MSDDEEAAGKKEKRPELRPENIRAVRIGHGANCSSVGSVIDTLFLASAVGGAIFAAVCAALIETKNTEDEEKEKEKEKEDGGKSTS